MVLIGCGREQEPTAPIAEPAEKPSAASERDGPSEVEMVASMEAHYGAVILAHDALLQSDIETFRAQLALASQQTLPQSSPREWIPLHEQLQTASADAAQAQDLDAAAGALASVVLACGTCHAALGTGPIYPAPAADDGVGALEAAMLDHQWATERLWEGVTGPWDAAWERGAVSLTELQVFGDMGPEVILSDDLRRREQELREIGRAAQTTQALDERAALYGRLLATCGECHRAIGVTFEESQ